jgi:hypothetical protein
MDDRQFFVFVNQEFNYSSLLETGICCRRQFKNSLAPQSAGMTRNSVCGREKHQISSFQNCTFISLLMAEKNNVGQNFLDNLRITRASTLHTELSCITDSRNPSKRYDFHSLEPLMMTLILQVQSPESVRTR